MRNDTAKRIKEYNKRLPKLKERLVAALVLLLVGTMMLTTVSFAWVTLSRKPEVSNITSSIASNGNLEIALASGTLRDLIIPGATQLGDGNLPILSGNKTWGNLINLSDPAYGLGNLVLRPAGLNRDTLLTSPLYGADFLGSGRHEGYIDSFRYAKWQSTNPDDPDAPWEFVISDELGVRAISSTIIADSAGYGYELSLKTKEATDALYKAQNAYIDITCNVDIVENRERKFLESLSYVMGAYMTANMNKNEDNNESYVNATMDKAQIETFRDLFRAFIRVLELEQEAMVKLANLQLFIFYKGEPHDEIGTFDELVEKINNTYQTTDSKGNPVTVKLQISGLNENISDIAKVRENYGILVALCERGGDIKWGDDNLNNVVNALVNVGSCQVVHKDLNGGTPTSVSAIGATAAYNLNKKSCTVTITNGILYNFEKRTGVKMDIPNGSTALKQEYPNGLTVKARGTRLGMSMDGTIYAKISTNAPSPALFQKDIDYANAKNTGGTAQLTANDTYGFAIDFWVRTNANGSFLTLQGNVLTETVEVDAKGVDMDGNEVQLYVITETHTDDSGEAVTVSADAYKKDGKWYLAHSHEEYTPQDEPKKKVNIIQNVIGYEGENRVWEDNAFISIDSTTQGSGSCYVFYYNSPEDMERSLKLLSAMNVAFIDEKGTLLAEGYMDTANAFLDEGKVIVPLRLNANSITITNPDGTETLAITPLEQNVAKLITAIVYLDGTKIENQDVLSASEVQGQLNIQFGSTADFTAMSNEKLASQYMNVAAQVDKTSFNYDESRLNNTPMLTNVTIEIDGSTPQSVSAFFVRQISATQAIPLNGTGEIMSFNDAGGGKWTSNYTFTSPGTYIIRSVWIDGVEYDIEPEQRPKIEVEGFTLKTLQWQSGTSNKSFMTASSSVSDKVTLEFMSNDIESMPRTVEGRFRRTDGNSVNVKFTRNSNNTWTGDVSFLSSGEYKFEFLYFDNTYYPVPVSMQITATVYLGMKAEVYTNSPLNFVFGYGIDGDPSNGMADNEENLYMQLRIVDDTGKAMMNLDDVRLYYSLGGYNTEVNGLDADMEWNQNTGYYEGEFHSKPGVFQFLYVKVGENIIRTSITSPRFIIQSPVPPSFKEGNTDIWQYSTLDNPAKLSVYLNDTDGIDNSSMIGIISDGAKEYRVSGVDMGGGKWQFTVPYDNNGTQEGVWTLKRIEIVGIYQGGRVTTEEDPYIIDLAGKDNLTSTVLSTIIIEMNKESGEEILLEGGAFLADNTLNNDKHGGLVIKDKNGNALPGLTEVTLAYKYQKGSSVAAGGYSFEELDSKTDITLTLTQDPDNPTHYILQNKNIKYAGIYALSSLHFTFDGGPVTLEKSTLPSAANIRVKTVAPTVTISAVSNLEGSSGDSISGNTATVYWGQTKGCTGNYTYEQPYVKLKISNLGKGTKAVLTFAKSDNSTPLLYEKEKSGDPISTFTWTSNNSECTRYVGSYTSGVLGGVGDGKTAAGTITANTLTVYENNEAYTFAIDTITIKNPS